MPALTLVRSSHLEGPNNLYLYRHIDFFHLNMTHNTQKTGQLDGEFRVPTGLSLEMMEKIHVDIIHARHSNRTMSNSYMKAH